MKTLINVIFWIVAVINLIILVFGLLIITVLVGIITGKWVTVLVIWIAWEGLSFWKREYYLSNGYKEKGLTYVKEDEVRKD